MKWFITGGAGFTGKYLLECITENYPNDKIVIFDYCDPFFRLNSNVSFKKGNLLDERKVKAALTELKPERIVHLAGIMRNENPLNMIKINTITCGTILDVIRDNSIPIDGFLVIGSVAQYNIANPEDPPKEIDPCQPKSLYGFSKLLQERLALDYFSNYDIPVICVRPSNIIGPKQADTFIIPKIISQILKSDKKLIKLHHLNSGRDYIDIRDIVEAYVHLFKSDHTRGEIFNIGNNKLIFLNQIIDSICKILNIDDIKIIESHPQALPDIHLTNSKKILSYVPWKPRYTLESTLSDMVTDYINNIQGMREIK